MYRPDLPMAERRNAHLSLGIGYQARYGSLGGMMDLCEGRNIPLEHREVISAPDLALLYVSKQVQTEALKAGWEGVKRCFLASSMFTIVADSNIGVAQRFNILGRIELSFTMKDWFKFFGLTVDPTLLQNASASLGAYLSALEDTCKLALRFRDPDDGILGDPWKTGSTTCQTVLIDWVVTFALPHIKHIKRINLTGCIKVPQKKKWMEILAKQRGSSHCTFDHAAAVSSILSTPAADL